MVMVYCSTFGLRFVYMVSALLLRSSNPGGTTKRKLKGFLFSFYAVFQRDTESAGNSGGDVEMPRLPWLRGARAK